MILPKKQVSLNESYFGFGAFLLQKLRTPKTSENLWVIYKKDYKNKKYNVKFSFDQYILVVDYLFMIGAIKEEGKGIVINDIKEFRS